MLKRIVHHERIAALKLKAEPVIILRLLMCMPTSEYEDDEVKELYGVIEEIHEEDEKGARNPTIMTEWNSVFVEKNHIEILLDERDSEGEIIEVKCSLTFVKEKDLLSRKHGLRSLREDCTHERTRISNT